MKYLPFISGTYTTAPALSPITKAEGNEKLVFQMDDHYDHYLDNKKACRKENIKKYFLEYELRRDTIKAVNTFIVNQLIKEYPEQFVFESKAEKFSFANKRNNDHFEWGLDWYNVKSPVYTTLFDALCSQVQEDVAVVQLENDSEYLTTIHLCSPNHWSPRDKIGKPFTAIHAPVPSMERTLLHYKKMLAAIVNGPGPSTRFAWGIATDTRLNHHPEAPQGFEQHEWEGRKHDENTTWYIRSERQNLVGFREVNAFLFTIRTYFYEVDELSPNEKTMLLSAIKSMTPESLQYKGLTNSIELLEKKLHPNI